MTARIENGMATPSSMLEGIRVADMTSIIFGPYCTQMLATLGADVIKVEGPAGDQFRTQMPSKKSRGMGKHHMTINRGKRSVNWDIKTADGREKMRRLLATSDVFIHNVRSDAIRRLGFDYEAVRNFAEDIVYVHCTGFDSSGPEAGRPAYDDIIQGAAGIASLHSKESGLAAPRYALRAVADKVAGLYALQATLAAIVHKLRSGRGQHVEVPMLESVAAFNLLDSFENAVFPDEPGETGRSWPDDLTRRPSPTADGYICIAAYPDDRCVRLLKAIRRPDLLEDERFSSPKERRRNAATLVKIIGDITPGKTTSEWLDIMRGADIPAMRLNSLKNMFDDPQLCAVKFFQEHRHPTEGPYITMRSPLKFSAQAKPAVAHAPLLGEHNAEIEAELGFDPVAGD